MLQIDRSSGLIRWTQYELWPNLTDKVFIAKHPEFSNAPEYNIVDKLRIRNVDLPKVRLEDQDYCGQVSFSNGELLAIHISWIEPDGNWEYEDSTSIWWQQQFNWLQTIINILNKQLGKSKERIFPVLSDEDCFLSEGEIAMLNGYKYRFKGATIEVGYHTETNVYGSIQFEKHHDLG